MAGRTLTLVAASVALVVAGYIAWSAMNDRGSPNEISAIEGAAAQGRVSEKEGDNPEIRASVAASNAKAVLDFEDLKLLAKGGDPVAQRKLAEVYDSCLPASRSREGYLADYKLRSTLVNNPQAAEAIVRLSNERAAECDSVDGGAVIPVAAVLGWYAQAAKNGDLAAQALVYMTSPDKPSAPEFKGYVNKVLNSNDPAAVFKLGELIGGLHFSTGSAQYDELLEDPNSKYALQIAACRMGYPCEQTSALMKNLCLEAGACAYETYEEFVRSTMIPSAAGEALDRKISEVAQFLEAH